jgi:hypothetical protein
MSYAYWISPQGETLNVTQSHIRLILDKPTIFNLHKDNIIDIYKKYGEKIGIEGKARAEIMSNLLKKGWIRIRYAPRNDYWTIQLYHWRESEKSEIKKWLEKMDKEDKINQYSELRILVLCNSNEITLGVNDIMNS